MERVVTSAANFDIAKKTLIEKLRGLDLNRLNLSDYSKNYLNFLIDDVWETLSRFEQVIREATSHSPKEISQMNVVDYGGGTGLLSLLAKEVGFKSVVYNDIFEGSCRDVEVLADACSLKLEAIVQGDARDLVDYLNANLSKTDLIVSYDVIEHVYDVKENFLAFSRLNVTPAAIIYGSGANIQNPFYARQVSKVQLSVENQDREKSYGHKISDSLKSYMNIRKEIIRQISSNLNENELEYLARSTRGLIKSDIENSVNDYLLHGNLNYQITHPTNTCDPISGNWCEHLLDFKWLISTAHSVGYRANISKGKYSPNRLTKRNILRSSFNIASHVSGRFGFLFSPFYILTLKPIAK
jgi:2-polyprenyl-3-methyl-5-hydroxy-6-metoxy-1,4-benzoquinol methylase